LRSHQHTDGCYARELVCGLSEAQAGHAHTEDCYATRQELTCGQEESAGHVHTQDCVSGEQVLICENTEPDHTHADGCYETRETYVCGLEQGQGAHTHTDGCYTAVKEQICTVEEPHVHTDSCYETVAVCGRPEHTHSLSCYCDPTADVESAETWERTVENVELTGVWGEDLSAIAGSQLGYRESEKNYIVSDDGLTLSGYTRYGAWYGDPYADWDALFAGFCLEYARIPQADVPRGATVAEWITRLTGQAEGYAGFDLYRGTDYAPRVGDVAFLDRDDDAQPDRCAIITGTGDGYIETVGGDIGGQVARERFELTDSRLLGYAELPENPYPPEPPASGETTAPAGTTAPTEPEQTEPQQTAIAVDLPAEPDAHLAGNSRARMKALLSIALLAEDGTLQNQINTIAAQEVKEGTVTLDRDYTENLVIPDDTHITLDLAGHTLSPALPDQTGDRNNITVFGDLTVTGGTLANSTGASQVRGITVAARGSCTLADSTVSGYQVGGSGGGVRVEMNGRFTMRGGTVTGCSAKYYGGGVYTYDANQLVIGGGTLTGNSAEYGGGIAVNNSASGADAPFAPENLTLSGNSAGSGGGIYAGEPFWFAPGNVTMEGNRAEDGGAGYFAKFASVALTGSVVIRDNTAGNDGGGLYFAQVSTQDGSRLEISGASVTGNTAGGYGGGIAFQRADVKTQAQVTMSGGEIRGNRAERGGGLYLYRRTAFTLSGGAIAENAALTHGGGFFLYSDSQSYATSFAMTGGELRGNRIERQTGATYGGGGYVGSRATVTLSGGTIAENSGACRGGGMYINDHATVTLEDGIDIQRNQVSSTDAVCWGAGLVVYDNSTFTMTGGAVHHNTTQDQQIYGVGLYLKSVIKITGGEIYSNTAQGGRFAHGGGIYSYVGSLSLGGDAKIYGNELNVDADALGGGICLEHYNSGVTVRGNASVYGNTVNAKSGNPRAGGIYCAGFVDIVENALVTGNTARGEGGGILCTTLTISGNAEISGNTANSTGGGALCNKLAITGGTVTGNKSGGSGGGIYLNCYSLNGNTNKISGGKISGNTAAYGGGLAIYGCYMYPNTGTSLTMTGGAITDNQATTSGGGVFLMNGARMVITKAEGAATGGTITGNRASLNGGGVAVNQMSTHTFADDKENHQAYALEVREGGCLQDNQAGNQGNDFYVYAYFYDNNWRQPYFHADPGAVFGGQWYDDLAGAVHPGEIDNLDDIKAMEDLYYPVEEGVTKPKPQNRYYGYTLITRTQKVARVDAVDYPSVQEAMDAVKAGAHAPGAVVTMLADSREDVVVPEDLAVVLDLAGHSLSALAGSALTVSANADLTLRDTSPEGTGAVKHGKGTRLVEGKADTYGGGACVREGGSLTLESGTFRENKATYGSAIFLERNTAFTMTGGSIRENAGADYALRAGYSNQHANIHLTIQGGEITQNTCGGITACGTNTTLVITGTADRPIPISGNGARGISLVQAAKLTASWAQICDNASSGVYLEWSAAADLTDCTVSGNHSSGAGAGVCLQNGSTNATLSRCTVSGNEAATYGGGIYAYGSLTLSDTEITGNKADQGGGVNALASANTKLYVLAGTRIWGNTASDPSGDLVLGKSSYFYGADGTMGTPDDTRAAKNMALPDGLRCWYDGLDGTYYVENGCPDSALWGVPVKPVEELTNTANQILAHAYLTAVAAPEVEAVAQIGDVTYPSVAAAMAAARGADGDPVTVLLLKDVTEGGINLYRGANGQQVILDLQGHVISAPADARVVFKVNSGASLALTDSSAGKTGALDGAAAANCRGVHVNGGSFTLTDAIIRNFTFKGNGAGILADVGVKDGANVYSTTLVMEGGLIENCKSSGNYSGGGIHVSSLSQNNAGISNTMRMTGGTIRGCTATNGGGIAGDFMNYTSVNCHHSMILSGGVIEQCTASSRGGGIYITGTQNAYKGPQQIEIYGLTVQGCHAGTEGGGIYVTQAGSEEHPFLLGRADVPTQIRNNSAGTTYGGVVIVDARARTATVVENVTIQGNRAAANNGGGHLGGAALTVRNVTVTDNHAGSSTGGIGVNGATLEMTDCTVSGNSAGVGGQVGGLSVNSSTLALPGDAAVPPDPIHIKDCVVRDNRAPGHAGMRISATRDVLLEDVTVTGNVSQGSGGGVILNHSSATPCTYTLRNCAIQNNTTSSDGSGGGIGSFQNRDLTVKLEGTDISQNRAGVGGGICMSEHEGTVRTSISHLIVGDGTWIHDNTASGNSSTAGVGGGIYTDESNVTIQAGTRITGNTASNTNASYTSKGGGIYCYIREHANLKPLLGDTITLSVEGGEISGNTADYGGGIYTNATTYGRQVRVEITGGEIRENHAVVNGGGISTTMAGSQYIQVTLGGDAVITGNTARSGGGVSGAAGTRLTLKDSARVTGNTATKFGGGIVMDANRTYLNQQGGSLFGNTALLGQDAYIDYAQNYRTSNFRLMDVASMPKDALLANAWLDESNSRTYTKDVAFTPAAKAYPITLVYTTYGVAAVVHDPDTDTYTAYDTLQDAIRAVARRPDRTGTVTLVSDTAESVTIPAGSNVTLNLAGYTLRGIGTSAITCRGDLTVIDDRDTHPVYEAAHAKTGVVAQYFPKAGDVVGTITGTAAKCGGGIYVDGGDVIMEGGQISGCRAGSNRTDDAAYGGAAVGIYAGSFTLSGGAITDNTAYRGAAVMLCTPAARFTMEGGKISGNDARTSEAAKSNGYGGAVYVRDGTAIITGGEISGNQASFGGGIYQSAGKLSVSGGDPAIRDNTALNQGGGIYAAGGTLTVTAGRLEDNRVTGTMSTNLDTFDGYSQSAGGGIYVGSATVNVGGTAVITGNRAIRGGGIFQGRGTVNILNGEITGNTAVYGGGIAQNPLPGDNSVWMHIMGGHIYGNTAQRDVGNDLYSRYEGKGQNYEDNWINKSRVPHMTILAAQNMGMPAYNVWKDDQYEGTERTGLHIGEGQFITASIAMSNSLALTADHFDTQIKTILNPHFYVETMKVVDTVDGTGYFDDGKVYQKVTYDNAAEVEKTAADLLASGEATDTGEKYDDITDENGKVIGQRNYIEYNGQRYEPCQAVKWWPGNDSGGGNRILRSFDTLTYELQMTIQYDKPLEFGNLKDNVYQIRFRAVLPCTSDKAAFDIQANTFDTYALTTQVDSDGNECQVLEAYWKETATMAAEVKSKTVPVRVYGMENGTTFKPTFEAYVVGNVENQDDPRTCASDTITVSAAPSYNVALDYNNSLTHTSYFDIKNGVELTKEMYAEAVERGETDGLIYGTMQGIGVTVELFNDPSGKGLKGLEMPGGDITFDLYLRGEAYLEGELVEGGSAAPYVWAYKPNDSGLYGTPLGGTVRDWNMNWNDVDDLQQNTHYAYNAAPYNTGAGANACYNGGSWVFSGSQPTPTSKETLLHCTVSDYTFNNTTNPTQNSDGKTDATLSSQAVKAFSAGYIQVLFPLDEQKLKDSSDEMVGYVEITMDAAVSKFDATSVSGQRQIREGASDLSAEDWKKQLDSLNGYFALPDSGELEKTGIAQYETRYADNYVMRNTALYIDNRDGEGPADGIRKENHFRGSAGNRLTNDAGTGETPISSTVYLEGNMGYSSSAIDASNAPTADPMYNAEFWSTNGEEYNYLTAVNLLQKFDASVYTPEGTTAVVHKQYNLTSGSNNIGKGAFLISTSETATNWTWNKNATMSYELTILYAAKPDGTNWTYTKSEEKQPDGKVVRDDGGVADMDRYREENLLYFETLDDLHAHFGGEGKCVAILYQFRNCCIRNGRSLTVQSRMKVTEELLMTGDTYCTTNDVRAWTTYRPHYKLYAAMNGMNLPTEHDTPTNPDDGKYHLTDLTYQFNWADVPYAQNAYGAVLAPGDVYVSTKDTDNVVTDDISDRYNDNREGNIKSRLGVYKDHYVKTEYSGGLKVKGTHTGMLSGNTLLLYTMDTSISIGIVTREAGSNAAKLNYNITNGEREVEYLVTPNISIASGAKSVELVTNGSQKTVVTIALELPEGLTYEEGSVSFDYTNSQDHTCTYQDGDLAWTVDKSNPRRILLQTPVSDIDRGLPKIRFKCRIGDAQDASKDIKQNGISLPVVSAIEAVYEEHNLRTAQTHVDSASIQISLYDESGVFESVEDPLREVGEDFVYTMTYSDTNETGAKNLQLVNVLPHNADGRGDSEAKDFTGGYRVQSIAIQFTGTTGEENYQNFLEKANTGEAFLAYSNARHPRPKETTDAESALLGKLVGDAVTGPGYTKFAIKSKDDTTNTVTFEMPADPLIQFAQVQEAYALFGNFPNVFCDSRFTIKLTLSPRNADGSLIQDASGNTQSGGQAYFNDFFYNAQNVTDDFVSAPVRSNTVEVMTVNRVISGTVWYDINRNGLMGTSEGRLKDVTVTLYQAKSNAGGGTGSAADGGDGAPDGFEPAVDILGNPVQPHATDRNGNYSFENLAEGTYIVVFRDDSNSYSPKDKENTPFEHLTVSNLDHCLKVDGNRSKPVPVPETPYWMTEARLYTTVALPAKDQIPGGTYESPHWNLGVYSAYGPEMPRTGGTGTAAYTAGGALLILCAGFLLLCAKRKRGKEDTPIS